MKQQNRFILSAIYFNSLSNWNSVFESFEECYDKNSQTIYEYSVWFNDPTTIIRLNKYWFYFAPII